MQVTLPVVLMASVVGVLLFVVAIQIVITWETAVMTLMILVLQVNS